MSCSGCWAGISCCGRQRKGQRYRSQILPCERSYPMKKDTGDILSKIVGQPCTRKEVGRSKSLSIGFGDEANDDSQKRGKRYKRWEIGTYYNSWRVVKGATVLLSNIDSNDLDELNRELNKIELGRVASIRQLSEFDVRVELDNGVALDFLGTNADEDEYFHVFGPENSYIQFSRAGWETGRSDQPWVGEPEGSSNAPGLA
jgi:hypothetical protein